jgi:hypothetical protein
VGVHWGILPDDGGVKKVSKGKTKKRKIMVTMDSGTFFKLLDLSKRYEIAPEKMAGTLLKQQLVVIDNERKEKTKEAA